MKKLFQFLFLFLLLGVINSVIVGQTASSQNNLTGSTNSQLGAAYSAYCPSGITSYWNLDETTGTTYYDSISVNNATSTDAPTPVTGRVSGGQLFNGTSDRMNAPRIAAYDFSAGSSFTFETWIKHPITTPTSTEQIIGRKASENLTSIALAFESSTSVTFSVRSSSGESFSVTGTSNLYDDIWHHVVAVKDGSLNQLRIYVDGVLENSASASYTSGFASPTAIISIGWRDAGDTRYFNGSLDEIAIYSTALSPSFISMHYSNGLLNKGYCATTAPTITTAPVTSTAVNQIYLYNVDASAYPVATYSLTTAPLGMTINSTTGLVEWIPTASGNYNVTVTASNGVVPDANQSFVLNVALTSDCLNGVVNYWKLDETSGTTYFDYAGNNNATSTDKPTAVTGRVAGAQQFNGSSDQMTAPRIAAYDFTAGSSFTFETWIKHPIASPVAKEQIIGRKASENLTSIALAFDQSANVSFSVRSSSGENFSVASTSNLYDNNWHHVVAVKDGSLNQLRLYVDGVLENTVSAAYTSGFTSPTATLSIGWRDAGDTRYFNGTIDELAIYNIGLSQAYISQHYNNGLQGGGYCYGGTAPTITSSALLTAVVGQLYSYDVEAAGTPTPTYALTTSPSGMTINSTTGLIQWTPSSTGSFDVTVVVSNSISPNATQSFTINVTDAPTCPSGIISYWKLDETSGTTFYDALGNINATSTNVPTPVSGKVNGAQQFNGISNRITIPANALYDWAANASFALEAWIKHPVGSYSAEEVVIARKATDSGLNIKLSFASTSLTFQVRSKTNQNSSVTGTTNLYDGNWHHVVGVKDGNTNQLKLYVDGELEGSTPTSYITGFDSPSAAFGIGYRPVTGDESYFNGVIDEVAIYNVALSINSVRQNYANGLQNMGYCYLPVAPAITSSAITSGMVGVVYNYDVNGTGSPAPLFSLDTYPSGMTIDPVTGVIDWIPSSTGDYSVTLKAANGVSPDATQSFTITVAGAPPCPIGMINYWKLEETTGTVFFDNMGLNNASSADRPTAITGIVGTGQRFNGTSDQMNAPRIAAYDFAANSSFTFETWIKHPIATPTTVEQVIGRKASENQTSIALAFDQSTSISLSVRSSSGESYSVSSTSDLYDDDWHHVVGVKDGSLNQLRIYVDGILENSVSAVYTSGFTSPTAGISIGWRSAGDERYLNGRIDELAIYNTALNSVLITQHFNNGYQFLGYCNVAPTITSSPVLTGAANQLYSYVVAATGTPAPAFSLTTAPSGMTISSTSGLIQWTPSVSGNYNVTVKAANGVDPDATQSFTINVDVAPACPNGIISYWNLDESTGTTFTDYVGGNTATTSDRPSAIIAMVNGGQRFNGTSDQMTAPRIAAYDFTANSSFTFETWIKHAAVAYTAIEQIVGRKASDNSTSIALAFDGSSNLTFSTRSKTGESFSVTGTSSLYDDAWHHVAAVKDGTLNQIRIYVDGVLQNTVAATFTSGFDSPTATLSIGWRDFGDTRYLNGRMDELAIYGVALEDAEILAHYYNGLQGVGYCYTNIVPTITSVPTKFGVVNQLYTYDVQAAGIPAVAYTLTTSPSGMTINANSGLIQWTPSSNGIFDVTVVASNSFGANSTQPFRIIVQSQGSISPIITSTPVTSGTIGQLYSYDVEASGVPTPTYSLTANPSGMTINSTSGLIQWTPAAAGNFNVTVAASNGVSPDAQQSFSISVAQQDTAPTITSAPDTTGIVGQLYLYDVQATGSGVITYSLTVNPSGMTINASSGLIHWIPSSAGNFNVTVVASNGVNPNASQSYAINVQAPPTSPSNLTAVLSSTKLNHVDLTWQDNSTNELGFILERKNGDSISVAPYSVIDTVAVGVTAFEDSTLADTTTYTYRVKAYNSFLESGYSNQASLSTILSSLNAPSVLTANLSPSDVNHAILSWQDNSTNELGFILERKIGDSASVGSFISLDTLASGITTFEDSTLSDTTTYTYRVRAFNAFIESGYSNLALVSTILSSIVSPSSLTANLSSTKVNHVNLTWQDNSTNELGFILERKIGDSGSPVPFAVLDSLTAGVTSFEDSTLSDTTTYTYRVKAFNSFTESGYSNMASVGTILSSIISPSNLTAVLSSTKINHIELNWQDNSSNELGFILERKTGESASMEPFTSLDTLAAGVSVFEDSTLSDTTTYTYRVKAFNALLESNYSNVASVSSILSTLTSPGSLTANLSPTKINHVELSWQDNSSNELGFILERKTGDSASAAPFTVLDTLAANVTEFEDSLLSDTTTYTYRVNAFNSFAKSGYSNQVSITTVISAIVREVGFEIPKDYALQQNYPNPFNPSTTIRFALPTNAQVEIKLFNAIGQEVELILSAELNAGTHEAVFSASRLASGIYFYMIKAQGLNGNNFTATKRMILMK